MVAWHHHSFCHVPEDPLEDLCHLASDLFAVEGEASFHHGPEKVLVDVQNVRHLDGRRLRHLEKEEEFRRERAHADHSVDSFKI